MSSNITKLFLKFVTKFNIRICLLILLIYSLSVKATVPLYPGEKLLTINGTQTLTKFIKGDPNKPLIIFVPGNSHLARIGYGYPSGNPKDFLSYWLHKKGYSFLGISYPIDNPVYSKVYPAFSIKDWGNQVAEAAKQIINENKLSHHIIVLGWSMGGSIENTVNVAAKQKGLVIDLFIGLSATPPLPYIMQSGPFKVDKMLPNGLADRRPLYPWFVQAIEDQNKLNHRVIIPSNIYLTEFLGNIPIAIGAEGYHYKNGKFIYDIMKTLEDGGVFKFKDTPWIALIRDDSPLLMNISFIDPFFWDFLRMQMVYQIYLAQIDLFKLSSRRWNQLKEIIDKLPNELISTVHGNHFFFVGEKGAMDTADKIDLLLSKTKHLKDTIIKIVKR
jgi:hypothetical protein